MLFHRDLKKKNENNNNGGEWRGGEKKGRRGWGRKRRRTRIGGTGMKISPKAKASAFALSRYTLGNKTITRSSITVAKMLYDQTNREQKTEEKGRTS